MTANTQKEKPRSSGSSATTSTDHNIIFIDTENTFRAERVHQIAETRRIGSVEEILKRIFVCKIYNSAHLEYVIANLGKSIEQCGIIFMHFQLAHPTENLLSEKKS